MKEKLKGFLIDSINGTARVVDFVDKLDVLYKLLNCDCIDITVWKVGKFEYNIVLDDEVLLKDSKIFTAFNEINEPVLVGNLLFCNHDKSGNLMSISDEQIGDLRRHLCYYVYNDGDFVRTVPCVIGMQFC